MRRSLIESALLTAVGGLVGLLLAWWGTTALRPLIPLNVPRASSIGLDLPVLAFTVAATVLSGLLVGLVPAWRAMRPNLLDILTALQFDQHRLKIVADEVVSYSVARRTAEIGVRMALGADADRTFRLVVGNALRVVLIRGALGLAGAAAAGRSLQSLLFGVPPLDGVTYAASGLAIVAIGVVAASLPALRAARIDPVGALRTE